MATTVTVLIAEITNIRPHPGADKLELCDVNGWQLVIGKGKYTDRSKIVYITIDSLIPKVWSDLWGVTNYLKGANKDRVGQVKLRGEPSFGLAVDIPEELTLMGRAQIGENVADFFGITKYEPPVKMRSSSGDADSPNPLIQKYTDIDNLRNYPKVFNDGEEVIATEKCHGTNCKLGYIDGTEVASSMAIPRKRPFIKVDDTIIPCELTSPEVRNSTYWFPWSIESVRTMLKDLYEQTKAKQILLYGEVFGGSIQKGHSYGHPTDIAFMAFDLLVDGRYYNYDDFHSICSKYGVPMCPVLYRGPYSIEAIKLVSGGKSTLDNTTVREGVVVQPVIERPHPKVGRLKMKYVSDDYLFGVQDDATDA